MTLVVPVIGIVITVTAQLIPRRGQNISLRNGKRQADCRGFCRRPPCSVPPLSVHRFCPRYRRFQTLVDRLPHLG